MNLRKDDFDAGLARLRSALARANVEELHLVVDLRLLATRGWVATGASVHETAEMDTPVGARA